MSTLISSPFFFDNNDVRDQCVAALGLTEALIEATSNEIVVLTASTTLTSDQINKTILVNSSSPTTITIPTEGSPGFGSFAQVTIIGIGTGSVTIAPAATVTINTTETLQLRKRYSGVVLIKRETDTWILTGDTIPATSGFITEVEIPEINTKWAYIPAENQLIENISSKGVTPVLSLGELYFSTQYQKIAFYAMRSIPAELQFDKIEIIHVETGTGTPVTGFSIKNLSILETVGVVSNVTFDIGVSPFAFGDEKWILAGIRISRVSSVWSCSLILNGSVISLNSMSSVNPNEPINVQFLNGTFSFTATNTSAVTSTKSTSLTTFSQPLYSRAFIQGPVGSDPITDVFSFDIALNNTVSNGQGNILPVRFTSLDGQIIEISGEIK